MMMNSDKKGVWGRPNSIQKTMYLPSDVSARISNFRHELNVDWTMFASKEDENLWLITRLWENENSFEIVASIVKFQSELVEIRND